MEGCGFILSILIVGVICSSNAESIEERMSILEMTVIKQGTRMGQLEKQVNDLTTILEDQRELNTNLQNDVQTMKHVVEKKDLAIARLTSYINHFEEGVNTSGSTKGQLREKEVANIENKTTELITNSEVQLTAVMHTTDGNRRKEPKITDEVDEKYPYSPNVQSLLNVEHTRTRAILEDETVAFHAILSHSKNEHMGLNQIIKFDSVILNNGNGYHNLLGVFIAPKAGLYLFSASVTASGYGATYQAYLKKNGIKLVSLTGASSDWNHMGQGSVTIVTEVQAGEEVMVVHAGPADGSIWGNYYSSFMGVLIIPM